MEVIKESVGGSKIGVDKVVISTVYKGSTIGEMSILHDYLRSATVRSRTQTHVVSLTKASFDLIVEHHARIGIKILMGLFYMLSRHLHKSTGRLADFILTKSETE
jgi:CRP-like cAMP-binding protein